MSRFCNCYKFNFKKKNYAYWENRKTTTDEIQILKYLEGIKNLKFKKILHIGIGNSSLAKKFSSSKVIGISISNNEINYAKSMKINNYKVFFCDKYSSNLNKLCKKHKFDYIIDTNLKSYSCCQIAFNSMIKTLINSLNRRGKIITSRNGMKWYKKLVPKLTFNFKKFFYFKMKEVRGSNDNILSLKELKMICNCNNLKLSIDKKLCYLIK